MTFFDCQQNICDQLNTYLQSMLKLKGFDVRHLVEEHGDMMRHKDMYSKSILLRGVPHRDAPVFANVPYVSFTSDLRENFEKVFEALGMPTTQNEVFRVSGSLRRLSLENYLREEQKQALENLDFVVKKVERVKVWYKEALDINMTMKSNLVNLIGVTTEEREFANMLSSFDWYYAYSDQASTRQAGDERHAEVQAKTMDILAAKPHLKKVVETIAAANGFATRFFTG